MAKKHFYKKLGLAAITLTLGLATAQAASLSPQHTGNSVATGANIIEARVCRTTVRRTCRPVRICIVRDRRYKTKITCTTRRRCRVVRRTICR